MRQPQARAIIREGNLSMWKKITLTASSVAVTVAGISTNSIPIIGVGLVLSCVSYSLASKPPNKHLQILTLRETKLKTSQHSLQQEQTEVQNQLRELGILRDELEKQSAAIISSREEFQKNQQVIYEQILNQVKLQANQYSIGLFQQHWKELQEREQVVQSVIPNLGKEWQERFNSVEDQKHQEITAIVSQSNEHLHNARKKIAEAGQFYKQMYIQATQGLSVELHELKQPQMPSADYIDEYPRSTLIAERSLRHLYDKGVYLDFVDCFEDPESVSILLKPKKGALDFVESRDKFGKQLPALQALANGVNAPPEFKIWGGMFRVDFDMSGLTSTQRSAKARSKEIEELPANWLEDVVRNCYHFRVNGQTRAGKSVFVNNLIGLMRRMYKTTLTVVLIDPKYPMSRWSIKPQYRGIEESILGLKAMGDEVERRLRLATEDADAGRPIQNFEPIIYIADEIDSIASEYGNSPVPVVAQYLESLNLGVKKAAPTLLKKGLKVGAALKVIICYIGQSPLCSAIGMNKNDFNNSGNFFLGENIFPAIEEVAFKHQQPYLKRQYALRQERAAEYAGTPDQNLYKYFALVKVPGMAPKLATLPLEGIYDFMPEESNRALDALVEELSENSQAVANWRRATPEALVASARNQILELVKEGITNPLEICRCIWGFDSVKPQSLPYNGKNGVKVRIEYLISTINHA